MGSSMIIFLLKLHVIIFGRKRLLLTIKIYQSSCLWNEAGFHISHACGDDFFLECFESLLMHKKRLYVLWMGERDHQEEICLHSHASKPQQVYGCFPLYYGSIWSVPKFLALEARWSHWNKRIPCIPCRNTSSDHFSVAIKTFQGLPDDDVIWS